MNKLLLRLNGAIRKLEFLIYGRFPPESVCLAGIPNNSLDHINVKKQITIKDLIGDGILWAVPRNRRTTEKRWKRKFGFPDLHWKLLVPKSNIRICNNCGHDHEVGTLCAHCYSKVRKETEIMQEKIQEELGLNPIDQEVVVLYDGEKNKEQAEFWQGKRVVDMQKQRPMWFSKNLMQKTTQQPAVTKEIKPNDLG